MTENSRLEANKRKLGRQ